MMLWNHRVLLELIKLRKITFHVKTFILPYGRIRNAMQS
jgi:hypothetical protein